MSLRKTTLASPLGPRDAQLVDEDLRRRVRTFLVDYTISKASERLGVGPETLIAARDGGRLRKATIERFAAALEREERELLARVAS